MSVLPGIGGQYIDHATIVRTPPMCTDVSLGFLGKIDYLAVQYVVGKVRLSAVEAGVPVGGPGFRVDDVNEKAVDGYQLINHGSTTGALKQTVHGWFDAYTVYGR